MISLIVDVNENKEIAILSLNVSNDYSIINFKSDMFKAAFDEILFEIKMKPSKLSIFFSTITYFF